MTYFRASALFEQFRRDVNEDQKEFAGTAQPQTIEDDDVVEILDDPGSSKDTKKTLYGDEEMSVEQNAKLDSIVDSSENFLAKAPKIQVRKINTEEACVHEVCSCY